MPPHIYFLRAGEVATNVCNLTTTHLSSHATAEILYTAQSKVSHAQDFEVKAETRASKRLHLNGFLASYCFLFQQFNAWLLCIKALACMDNREKEMFSCKIHMVKLSNGFSSMVN